jgi:GntR family transcriptional regulator
VPNEDPKDGCEPMNATADVMLTGLATASRASRADDRAPDAPTVPSFSYARVAEALARDTAGRVGPPHGLTIAAQLAALLRARIGSGELARGKPIPGGSALMQQYGVTQDTVDAAVRTLVAEGLVYVVEGRGAYVAWRA